MTHADRCAVAVGGLLAALVMVACGDDGGVEVCTGTCITVSNVSTLTVNEVNYTACGVSGWGANRLGSGEIAPGEERSWAVTAGCYDVQDDLEKASCIRLEEEKLKKLHEQMPKQWVDNLSKEIPYVGEEDIEYTVAKMAGIPLSKLEEKESEKLMLMEDKSSTRG